MELNEIINSRAVSAEISATGEYQVLAVDVFGPWAAVFRFSVLPNGDFDTDTDIAGLRSGSWDFYTGGGLRGGKWDLPWRRPRDGWPHGHLLTFGHCGMDVTVADGETVEEIIAVSGFVSAATDAVRVTTAGNDRTVVPSQTGAFVAVGLGRDFDYMTVTATRDGVPRSPGYSFPSQH